MAKRVNKKFLILFTGGIVALFGSLSLVAMLAQSGDPRPYIAAGDKAFASGDYKLAKEQYNKALRYAKDPELYVKIGDTLQELSRNDPNELTKYTQAWSSALELNPRHVPALQRMMQQRVDIMEIQANVRGEDAVRNFRELGEKAGTLAAADPSNVRARLYVQVGLLGMWLNDQPAANEDIERAISALVELMPEGKDNAEIPFWIGRARFRQGADLLKGGNAAEAEEKKKDAIAVFETALKDSPENAEIFYRQFQLLRESARMFPPDAKGAAELSKAMREALSRAQELAKPDAQHRREIAIEWAYQLQREGKAEDAEAALRKVMEQRPADQWLRHVLAEILSKDPKRRPEAIELLARPMGEDLELKGVWAPWRPRLNFERRIRLIDLRVLEYANTPKEDRLALRQLIQDEFEQLAAMTSAGHPAILKIRADIVNLDGDRPSLIKAIGFMQEAVEKLDRDNAFDAELMMKLANAYRIIGQTGQARGLMLRVLSRNPTYVQGRKMLVQLLIGEKQYKEALEHVEVLLKVTPEDTELPLLRIDLLAQAGRKDQAQTLAKELPEASDAEKLSKGRAAALSDDQETAIRLLGPLSQEERKDAASKLPATQALLRMHLSQGRKEQAEAVMRDIPEASADQRLIKASAAMALDDESQALPLLVGLSKEELAAATSKLEATQLLVRLHLIKDRKEEAGKVLQAVMAKSPADPSWKVLQAIAEDKGSPEQLRALRAEAMDDTIADPAAAIAQAGLLAKKKPQEALKVLLAAEQKTGGAGAVVEAIFNHYLQQKDLENAGAYARKLEAINWDQASGLSYRTMLAMARGDGGTALRSAVDLTQQIGHLSQPWVILGKTQQMNGLHEAAIISFNSAMERQLDNPDALRGVIESNLELHQFDTARKYVEQGMKTSRNKEYFREVSMRMEEQVGNPASVTASRERDLEANKESLPHHLALADNYAKVGEVLMARRDDDGAKASLVKGRAGLEEALKKWPDEAAIYARLADLAWREGKPQRGEEILNTLAARDASKGRPEPMQMIAVHLQRMGPAYWPKAEEQLKRALEASSGSVGVRRQLAGFYTQTGQVDKAIEALSSLYQDTKDAGTRNQMIEAQTAAGKFADAEKSVLKALEGSPNDPRLLGVLAGLKIQMRDYDAALARVEEMLRINSKDPVAFYHRGRVKLIRKDFMGAVVDLTEARNISSGYVDVRVALSEVYLIRRQIEEASNELEAAIQLAPNRGDLRVRLIELYVTHKRWGNAERLLDQAKANPDQGRNPVWLKLESQMYTTRGDLQKSMASIQQAVKLAPNDPELYQLMLEALHKNAKYPALLAAANDLLENPQSPHSWWAHMMRGNAYKALGKPAETEADFDSALSKVDQENADAAAEVVSRQMSDALGIAKAIEKLSARRQVRWLGELAALYLQDGNWAKACETADQLLGPEYANLSPQQRMKALMLSGQIYSASMTMIPKVGEKAEAAYLRYIEEGERQQAGINPELIALNNLACLFVDSKPEKALTYSQRAYGLMMQTFALDPNIMDTHAWVLIRNDKVDEGVEILDKVLAKENAPVDAYYHLGEAMLRKSMPEAAQGHLEKAQKIVGEMKARREFYDPALEASITGALARAKAMLSAAAPQAP